MQTSQTRFVAVFEAARSLRAALAAANVIVDEAPIEISPEGLRIRALDGGNMAMVDLNIPYWDFSSFHVPSKEVVWVNLKDLIKMFPKKGQVALRFDGEWLILEFGGGISAKLKALDPYEGHEIPNLRPDFLASGTFAAEAVATALRTMKEASGWRDTVKIEAEPPAEFRLVSKCDVSEVTAKLEPLWTPEIQEKARSSFHLDYLLEIVSAGSKVSKTVEIAIGNRHPIRLSFPILPNGSLVFYLAPRIDE
jgi:proliferating cell nuclear antigen